MTNIVYFFIAILINFVFIIIDGIAHQKFKKTRNIIFHVFGSAIAFALALLLIEKEFNLSLLIYPGIFFVLLGLVFVYLSKEIKGNFLSAKKLVKKGIYARTRHPMYLGIILILIGIPLISSSLLVALYSFITILMIFWLIRYEEKHLAKKFGKEYEKYKKETPILFPEFYTK